MSKTEVSGKQLKDGSVELVDLAPEVSGVLNTLQSDVATLQTDVAAKADAGTLASVATSGSYNDLSDKPTIPSLTQVEGDISSLDTRVTAVEGDVAALEASAFSGSYTDLTNKPSLFSGSYTDLTDKPTIPSISGLATETYVDTAVAGVVNSAPAVLDTLNELAAALGNDENFATTVAGQIGDVASDVSALDTRVTAVEADVASLQGASTPNLSDLGGVSITSPTNGQVLQYNGTGWVNGSAPSSFSGSYNDLTDKPTLFSGSYVDLTNKPTLFDGAYSSLTGTPTLATVATSGSYADLSNKPTLASFATITSPASGHHLRYNGSAWVNAAIPASDLPVAQQSSGIIDTGFQIFSGDKRFNGIIQAYGGVAAKAPAINQPALRVQPAGASQSIPLIYLENTAGGAAYTVDTTGASAITLSSASAKGLVIKGAASQSATMFELQNSAGTQTMRINQDGTMRMLQTGTNTYFNVSNAFNESIYAVYNDATGGWVYTGTQIYFGVSFGFNLANRCFAINPNGENLLYSKSLDGGAGQYTFTLARNTSLACYEFKMGGTGHGWNFTTQNAAAGVGIDLTGAPEAKFHVNSTSATRKGIIARAHASQTANMLEIQNSAGTALTVIGSSGNVGVGTASTSVCKVEIQGSDTTSSNYGLTVRASNSAHTFYTRNDGLINTGLQSQSPYNATTASAANVVVDANGSLLRSTSSLKYKTNVQNATHGLSEVLQLRSVTYKGNNDGDKVFGGLIAEEVHGAGLTEFVQYAADGTPDALAYGNMVSLAFKAIQELNAKVDALQAEKEALEARLTTLENN